MKKLVLATLIFVLLCACGEDRKNSAPEPLPATRMAKITITSSLSARNVNDIYQVSNYYPQASVTEKSVIDEIIAVQNSKTNGSGDAACVDVIMESFTNDLWSGYHEGVANDDPAGYRITVVSSCRNGNSNPQWTGIVQTGSRDYHVIYDTIKSLLISNMLYRPEFTGDTFLYFDDYGNLL